MRRRATVPARVNIIGEHTDYAGGLALPFAVRTYLVLEASSREEGYTGDSTIVKLWQAANGWPANLTVESAIPIGKGMSSSAALCLAVVLCAQGGIGRLEACKEAQRIEHEVLGTPCGLLDQMAMMFAIENQATLIDFSKNSVQHAPLPGDWKFKLIDSDIHRSLSSTEYSNDERISGIHVEQENERVRLALHASAVELGKLLNASHSSLSTIGVSTPEIDSLVASIQSTPGVLGARMMGGGFGGMILALVESTEVFPDIAFTTSSGPAILEEFL
mgnify:CR=1 FL=1